MKRNPQLKAFFGAAILFAALMAIAANYENGPGQKFSATGTGTEVDPFIPYMISTTGSSATDLGKAEDAAHASGDVGMMPLTVRANTPAATGANGDYVPLLTDTNGRLHVIDANNVDLYPQCANTTMTDANTEYTVALPAGTKHFSIQCRDGTEFRYAFVTGKVAASTAPFMTARASSAYNSPDKTPVHTDYDTIYIASGSAAKVVEVIAWTSTAP